MLVSLIRADLWLVNNPGKVANSLGDSLKTKPQIVFLPVSFNIRRSLAGIFGEMPYIELPILGGGEFVSIPNKDWVNLRRWKRSLPKDADKFFTEEAFRIVEIITDIQSLVILDIVNSVCIVASAPMVPWLLLSFVMENHCYGENMTLPNKCLDWESKSKLGVVLDTDKETLTDILI